MTAPRYVVWEDGKMFFVGQRRDDAICPCVTRWEAELIAAALNAYNQPQEQEQKQEDR